MLAASLAASAGAPGPAPLGAGFTALRFQPEILTDLAIEIVDVRDAASAPVRDGALAFALTASSSSATFDAVGNDFEGFAAADLRHAGGFTLRIGGARVDFTGFRLTASPDPKTLELRDAGGRLWLLVDKPHAVLAAGRLELSNADLLIAPELALLLDRPDLAGSYLGVLDAQLALASEPSAQAAAPAGAPGPLGGECVGDFSQPVDLLMDDLSGMTQVAREPGGRVAIAPGAVVRNLGPGDVQWYRSIAPASPVGPHPYLALHFYRLAGGVLEQIGRGDLKHTFFSTNTDCDCPGGQILYAGCEDYYGVFTNVDRINLAPRDEIDAFSLVWSSLGSHFDGVPVDDFRHHGGDSAHDAFQHRLVVREPDLQTPGARYFYDGWYIAPNDTNLENSMGHREVDPAFAGSTWSFPTVDAGTANTSILDVFVDPLDVQPGQATELHDTGEGRVHLAVVSTARGGGVYHYEYALMNFDFERKIASFSIPVGAGQIVSDTGFGDANGNASDDWTASVGGGRVTWTAPAGNALDWGTLYNFRFDVNAPPGETLATLTPLDAGSPSAFAVRTVPEPAAASWAGIGVGAASIFWLSRRRAAPDLRAGSRTIAR